MCDNNQTQVTYIRLLGFQDLYKFKALLFVVFFLTYIMTLTGNILIIILVTTIDNLKIPMFLFLKHLAMSDILITTTVVPMTLHNIFLEEGRLPFVGCLAQVYCFNLFGAAQCFLIAVMSYDRFLAICYPLHYTSLMSLDVCFQLVVGSWLLVTIIITSESILVCKLNFCGRNDIDHFFCDTGQVVELATSDTFILMIQDYIFNILVVLFPFVFIIMTYLGILLTIVKMSSQNRRKAFYTCGSHLTTVCIFYGTLITVYINPSNETTVNIKYRSLLYIIVTPFFNPIIYSLSNQKMKRGLRKYLINFRKNILYVKPDPDHGNQFAERLRKLHYYS